MQWSAEGYARGSRSLSSAPFSLSVTISGGGLDVDVGGTTEVTGGIIGSESNQLDLTITNLVLNDLIERERSRQVSLNASFKNSGPPSSGNTPPPINSTDSGGSEFNVGGFGGAFSSAALDGITRATIGQGNVTVTGQSEDETAAQLADTNRDINNVTTITRDTSFDTGNIFIDVGAAKRAKTNRELIASFDRVATIERSSDLKYADQSAVQLLYDVNEAAAGREFEDFTGDEAEALLVASVAQKLRRDGKTPEQIKEIIENPQFLTASAEILSGFSKGRVVIEDIHTVDTNDIGVLDNIFATGEPALTGTDVNDTPIDGTIPAEDNIIVEGAKSDVPVAKVNRLGNGFIKIDEVTTRLVETAPDGVVEGINALILGAAFLSGGTAFLKGAVKAIGEDKIVTTGGNIVSAATVRNDTISQFGDRKVVDERRDSLSGGVNTTLGVLIGAGIAKKKTPEAINPSPRSESGGNPVISSDPYSPESVTRRIRDAREEYGFDRVRGQTGDLGPNVGNQAPGSSGGPTASQSTTRSQRDAIRAENERLNSGVQRCEDCGVLTIEPIAVPRGGTVPRNQSQIDHIDDRVGGGNTTDANLRNTCAGCNNDKATGTRDLPGNGGSQITTDSNGEP